MYRKITDHFVFDSRYLKNHTQKEVKNISHLKGRRNGYNDEKEIFSKGDSSSRLKKYSK